MTAVDLKSAFILTPILNYIICRKKLKTFKKKIKHVFIEKQKGIKMFLTTMIYFMKYRAVSLRTLSLLFVLYDYDVATSCVPDIMF